VIDALRVHPRVAQQGIGEDLGARERLLANLPRLVPFAGRRPHEVVALLDWDHRLPSKQLFLRLHANYDDKAAARFAEAYTERFAEMQRRDVFPEFDIPDFAELPGDESYEAGVSLDLDVESMRLVSPWRRRIKANVGGPAVEAVRASPEFAKVRAAAPGRSANLGDLEPVAWIPPCESGHPRWTVDVWWLTAFDGRIGRGWSFLVDVEADPPVVSHREFSVRAG
jgi:hypothetical protein